MQRNLALLIACAACSTATPATAPAPVSQTAEVAAAVPSKVIKREVIILSRKSGASVTTVASDGTITVEYQHIQNGRGPKLTAKMRFAADGTLAFYEAKGTQEMLLPIEESFSIENKHAKWKTLEESGEAELGAPAFYLPLYAPPEIWGYLFHALEKNGGKLALLPGATATLAREKEVAVKSAAGEEKKLISWTVSGVDLSPTRFFTEEDGTFFGFADEFYACLPEGWEAAIDPLIALRKTLDAERDRGFAEKLPHHPPAAGLVITHARVFDSVNKQWLADHAVVIVKGKITSVGPAKKVKTPKGAEVIDAGGKALLPGLWDMHSHLQETDGRIDIASGVTTVRDLGNDPDRLDDLKKAWDSGAAIGPHVFRSGFIEGRGPQAAASKITAETPEEAKTAVEFYAGRSYEGIKIYNSIKPELVPVLAKLAHEKHMRVSGHIPAFMLAEDAVRAGYDEIQHINMVFLNFVADRTTDTRSPLRFSLVGDKAADLDLASKPVSDFIKLLQEKKTVIDPTVGTIGWLFVARQGEVPKGYEAIASRLPLQVQRQFKSGGLPLPKDQPDLYERSYAKLLAMVKLLHSSGVTIVAGTDANPPGLSLHRELAIYVEAGLTPGDAILAATLVPARVMKKDKESGSIATGKDADLVLIDGDPLAKIYDLSKVVSTVKSGVVYSSPEVYATVSIAP